MRREEFADLPLRRFKGGAEFRYYRMVGVPLPSIWSRSLVTAEAANLVRERKPFASSQKVEKNEEMIEREGLDGEGRKRHKL